MGFFSKLLRERGPCPYCGETGRDGFGGFECSNAQCRNYRPPEATPPEQIPSTQRNPATGERISVRTVPVTDPVTIEYLNYRNEKKILLLEKTSLTRAGRGTRSRHIRGAVSPSGRFITLKLDRIQNAKSPEVAPVLLNLLTVPSPKEQKILLFHLKKHSTSAEFEKLKAQYPQWVAQQNVTG